MRLFIWFTFLIVLLFLCLWEWCDSIDSSKENNTKDTIIEKQDVKEPSIYSAKQRLLSKTEQSFFAAIKDSLPERYYCFPQINLATFIDKNDGSKYRNELFRNVDFLIVDLHYKPVLAIEINDESHKTTSRWIRDKKVKEILEGAEIPLITFWTEFGVNRDYIKQKLNAVLANTK